MTGGLAQGGGGTMPLLSVEDVRVWFKRHRGPFGFGDGWVKAVDGVSFALASSKTLGLVGESGSGKTTVGRAVVRALPATSGRIVFDGEDLATLRGEALRHSRARYQMVFQDPFASLDPRQTVGEILAEPLKIHGLARGAGRTRRVRNLLDQVGLPASAVNRVSRQFSGGQLQRIGVARALAVEPQLIVCDEPVSALDVSIQAQIVNLLMDLQAELGLTYLFIAHDLAVVRHIADEVAVMYLGRIVERAATDTLFSTPRHPYTIALLSAVPTPDVDRETTRSRIILTGDVPSPARPPAGCRFHTRCWLRERLGRPERCVSADPGLVEVPDGAAGHVSACHFVERTAGAGKEMTPWARS
jgi:oligopeptide/dipeptide ABC transporter ATP-binding protein